MEILMNNKIVNVQHDYTVKILLEHNGYSKNVAVFVNRRQLLMSEYDNYKLNQNDDVKVIRPLGGG